jgi:hypothetical protein
MQVDGSGRSAGDTRTPGGVPLPHTDLAGLDAGRARRWSAPPGISRVAGREYRTRYGVPSSFAGAPSRVRTTAACTSRRVGAVDASMPSGVRAEAP